MQYGRTSDEQGIPFDAAKKTLHLSDEGLLTLRRLEKGNVIVQFREVANPDVKGFYFSFSNRSVIGIVNSLGKYDSFEASNVLVHEAEHYDQRLRFPELHNLRDISIVDQFVAIKLREWMAHYREHSHALKAASFLVENEPPTPAIISDFSAAAFSAAKNKTSQNLAKLSPARRYLAEHPDPLDDMSDVLFDLSIANWVYHEETFVHDMPSFEVIYESGLLEERVALSPFLQIDFLERFCLDNNSRSLVPSDNKQQFVEKVIQGICTLHMYQPQLSAKQGRMPKIIAGFGQGLGGS